MMQNRNNPNHCKIEFQTIDYPEPQRENVQNIRSGYRNLYK